VRFPIISLRPGAVGCWSLYWDLTERMILPIESVLIDSGVGDQDTKFFRRIVLPISAHIHILNLSSNSAVRSFLTGCTELLQSMKKAEYTSRADLQWPPARITSVQGRKRSSLVIVGP